MDQRQDIARAKVAAAPTGERAFGLGLLLLVLVVITAHIMGAALAPAS